MYSARTIFGDLAIASRIRVATKRSNEPLPLSLTQQKVRKDQESDGRGRIFRQSI